MLVGGPPPTAADDGRLTPGTSYFGRNGYIEYIAGDLPLVISVPHGGDLRPDEIPDREQAVTVADTWSIDYALAVADVIYQLTGHRAHVVINHLQRVKLDANRDLAYGAQDSPEAQQAWHEFHEFIDLAETSAVEQCGRGLYLDLHTNGQAGGWVQLGYGVPASDFLLSNEDLDRPAHVAESSLRSLSNVSGEGLAALLRGEHSLGSLLEARGYRAVPSNIVPWPHGITYYDGGYNLFRHGSRNGGGVDGIQIETSIDYVRPESIQTYSRVLGEAILSFMEMHYGFNLAQREGSLCPAFADVDPAQRSSAAIEALYKEGIALPCSESPRLFCPGSPLTRGDAAQMIGRALLPATTSPSTTEAVYHDIPADDPLTPWVTMLWQAGLMTSCRRDRLAFCPNEGFTRVDAAKAFLQLLKGPAYVPPPPSGLFSDLSEKDWRTWWAEAAYAEGLLQPCGETTSLQFCPDEVLSRAQGADILAAIVEARPPGMSLAEDGGSLSPGKTAAPRATNR
jgi:hypothetical protein